VTEDTTKVGRERILVVDDEENMVHFLTRLLAHEGYEVTGVASGTDAVQCIKETPWDLVLCDLKLPGMDGMEVLKAVRETLPEAVVIMITAYGTIPSAIEAIRAGAYDYVTKPFRAHEILAVIDKGLERIRLRREVEYLRRVVEQRFGFGGLVGKSKPMQDVFTQIEKVAATRGTVLIQGESGTGKELVAEVIHQNGPRKSGPFIKMNCAAIPEGLLESELLGHERGAFTGATTQKPGKFELAHAGTLFLDEVGDMALATQAKILRALEDREIYRVGGTKPVKVDVRVIAATNKPLAEAVQRKEFREDLYYRLNVFPILLPPLRERVGDIPLLVEAFLPEIGESAGKSVKGVCAEALERLMAYSWPGNVRELRNVIERATLLAEGEMIQAENLPLHIHASAEPRSPGLGEAETLDGRLAEMERSLILEALKESRGVQAQAARRLGINERSLWYRIKKFGIDTEKIKEGQVS